MGVRHLSSFVKEELPNCFTKVDIKKEIEAFQGKHNIKPIIVVDLCNFVSFMNRNMSELLCGGRHRQYCEIFNKFFQSLKDAGAELVFFEDGAVQETKNEEWCKRQDSKYKNTMVHIKEIDCLERLEKVIQLSDIKINPEIPRIYTFLDALEICAETLGKLVRSVTVECDLEMAEYATQNNALAILADDSDFLIFPGNWFHWSIIKINETEMTTMKFDRKKLRLMLTLKDHQMPILATIAGNDIVPYECLKGFHRSLKMKGKYDEESKFTKFARFINSKLNFSKDPHDIACEIARSVLDNSSQKAVELVEISLKSYDYDYEKTELDPFLQACDDKKLYFASHVLGGNSIHFSTIYFDMRSEPIDEISLFAKVSVALFRRQMGALLYHQKAEDPVRTVFLKMNHETRHKDYRMRPIYPPEGYVPSIKNLLFFAKHQMLEKKFKLLKWIIDAEVLLSDCDLKTIPKSYLVDVLLLVFLVKTKLISVEEADLILLSIKKVIEDKVPAELKPPEVLHPRAFRVSFIFTRFYYYIRCSFDAAGLKQYKKILDFDGVLFHTLYLENTVEDFANLKQELREINHFCFYDK